MYIERWYLHHKEATHRQSSPDAVLNKVVKESGENVLELWSVSLATFRLIILLNNSEQNHGDLLSQASDLAWMLWTNHKSQIEAHFPESYAVLTQSIYSLSLNAALEGPLKRFVPYVGGESRKLVTKGSDEWLTHYHTSLESVKQRKDFSDAIPILNQSLKLNPYFASSWRLLAIMLFMRSDAEQARRVCELGIKECMKATSCQSLRQEKRDLLEFSFLRIDIDVYLYGAKSGMDLLQNLFALYTRVFGTNQEKYSSDLEVMRSPSASSTSTLSSLLEPGSEAIQILSYLWLKTAGLYKDLHQFDLARSSIEEAKKLIDLLAFQHNESSLFAAESSPGYTDEKNAKRCFII